MLRDIVIPKELIARTDLTLAEKFVAAFLSDGHYVTAVEIADALNITRVTVYRSLKKLIEGGFPWWLRTQKTPERAPIDRSGTDR